MKFDNVCETRSRKMSGTVIEDLAHEPIGVNLQLPVLKDRDHVPVRDPGNRMIVVLETCKWCGCFYRGETE